MPGLSTGLHFTAMPDFSKMSDAELEAANQALQAQRSEIGEQQEVLAAEIHKRGAEARTASLLEGMAPSELDVLVKAAAAQLAAAAANPAEGEDA